MIAARILMAREAVMAGSVGHRQRNDAAAAQRATGVRTSIGEREIAPVDVEDADVATLHGHDLRGPGHHLARPGNHLPAHVSPYNALALSRNTLRFCSSLSSNLKACCG